VRLPGDAKAPEPTVPAEHFDCLYADKEDPWGFKESWYEQRKYAITVAALPRERYQRCLEIGCSIGEMTKLLAPRCDHVLAVDSAEQAIKQASEALRELDNVQVERAVLPGALPEGTFDLVVTSEILYYFSVEDLTAVLDGVLARMEPGGDFLAVHWRSRETSVGYDGFNVHDTLRQRPELDSVIEYDDESFVLNVFRRRAADA
jgi:cyclopropane fatty-acyl-phospholipid synthase-like methyltransferase